MQTVKKYEWGESVFTLLSWFKQDKVRNAKVLVVGAGALGNEVIKNLTLFGVGTIFVCDFDRIELSNLTRSVLFYCCPIKPENSDSPLARACA